MTEISRALIFDTTWDADLDEHNVYEDYSGRGMYGRSCFGIVGSPQDFAKFMVQLTDADFDVAWELANSVNTDSMAGDTIFYFPGYQLEKDKEDEEVSS